MIRLYAHQVEMARRCAEHKRYLVIADCGTGKTLALLAHVAASPAKTLIVCPLSIMRSAWVADGAKIGVPVRVLWGATPGARRRNMEAEWRTGVINYEGFKQHAAEWSAIGVRRIIFDESSKLKSHDSQVSKAAHKVSDTVPEVYLLTATPAPNSPVEYWSQLRCIGRHASGHSYYGFQASYTVPLKKNIWRGGRQVEITVGHRQTPDQQKRLAELLARHSWTVRKEDCLDLPPQHTIDVPVFLGPEQRAVYDAAADGLPFRLDDDPDRIVQFKGDASLIKCRQIVGGAVKIDGTARAVGNAKLEALGDLLDSLGPRPVVIWAEFTAEIDAIEAYCRERGETVSVIDGRTSHRAAETAAAFQAWHTLRLICHPQAAGHGITLHRAAYAIYYSLGFSQELWAQSRDRIHRIGQASRCTYYRLVAQDTVDHAAVKIVERKSKAAGTMRDVLAEVGGAGMLRAQQAESPCTPTGLPCTTNSPLSPPPCSPPRTLSRSGFSDGLNLFPLPIPSTAPPRS